MRSPGPGPITLAMWRPLTRSCFVKGQPVVLHTDSARAYSLDVPDITHTSISSGSPGGNFCPGTCDHFFLPRTCYLLSFS
eukprot:3722815-Amphidinium_carterae.1